MISTIDKMEIPGGIEMGCGMNVLVEFGSIFTQEKSQNATEISYEVDGTVEL
jgi:hypothetical protein